MASKPWFDPRRKKWVMKYKPDPLKGWERVVLGEHPEQYPASRPPKKVPQVILDRAKKFADIEYRVKHGISAAPVGPKPLALYIDEYVSMYVSAKRGSSITQLRRHSARFLAFALERDVETVQAVSRALCRDFLEACAKDMNPNSLQTMKGFLSPIWSRAVEDGLLPVNPWNRLRVPGKRFEPEPTFWTPEEITAIAANCAKPWQADLVLVLANTGVRISAGLNMRWDWINWQAGTIAIPKEFSKGKPYVHLMGPLPRQILERRKFQDAKGSPLVFPNPLGDHGPVTYGSAYASIERAIVRAGTTTGTPHDLRHSYGRALALAGTPIPVIQSQLGHATLSMVQKYIRTKEDSAARFIEGFQIGQETPRSNET